MNTETDSKKHKKRRFKKRYWLLIDLAVVITVVVLLLYKPSGYKPNVVTGPGRRWGQVHPYWTYLSSEIYNGAQLQKPFAVLVFEEKVNEAIAGWSEASEDVILSAPAVYFESGSIALMGTADIRGVGFILTIALVPKIDENKLLNLQLSKVKIGAVNITPLVRMIAKRMYAQPHVFLSEDRSGVFPIDTEDWRTKLVGALLNNEPFEPVFTVEDKKILLKKITIAEKKLTLNFISAP